MATNEPQKQTIDWRGKVGSAMIVVFIIIALLLSLPNRRREAYRTECEKRGGYVTSMARMPGSTRCNDAKPTLPDYSDWQP